jgi:hypothetical protein
MNQSDFYVDIYIDTIREMERKLEKSEQLANALAWVVSNGAFAHPENIVKVASAALAEWEAE